MFETGRLWVSQKFASLFELHEAVNRVVGDHIEHLSPTLFKFRTSEEFAYSCYAGHNGSGFQIPEFGNLTPAPRWRP
jgi:hypothetical protein